jgi:hypothetical protein
MVHLPQLIGTRKQPRNPKTDDDGHLVQSGLRAGDAFAAIHEMDGMPGR